MSAYSDLILATSGLLSYWRFGESSGTSVADAKGSLTGTSTSVTPGATGAIFGDSDTAYTFGAFANRVSLTNDASLQLSSGSLECWFKTTTPGAGFIGLALKTNAYSIFLVDNEIGWYDWVGGGFRGSGISPNDGQWHHAVMVFDSGVSNGSFLYLDGALVRTGDMTVEHQLNALVVGAGDSGGSQYFAGDMDEVAVYSSLLSLATVQQHYDMGVNGPPPSAPALRPFNVRTNALLRR